MCSTRSKIEFLCKYMDFFFFFTSPTILHEKLSPNTFMIGIPTSSVGIYCSIYIVLDLATIFGFWIFKKFLIIFHFIQNVLSVTFPIIYTDYS